MSDCHYCENGPAGTGGSHAECIKEFGRRLDDHTCVRCDKPTGGTVFCTECLESGPAAYSGYPGGGSA